MLSAIQWMSKIPFDTIRQIASEFNLEPLLLAAMIIQESSGDPCAIKFEPRWRYVWKPATFARMAGTDQDTEVIAQKMSWGPMQVMGTVAREQGFSGPLPELCKFDVGTYYGAKVLAKKLEDYEEINDAISAYNMGTPKKWENESQIKAYLQRFPKLPRRPRVGDYYNQYYVDRVREYWTQLGGA